MSVVAVTVMAGGDHAGGDVDEGDGVVAPPLPSMTEPAGVRVLPVPTLAVSKVWVNPAVSPTASVPAVIVGDARRAGGGVVDLVSVVAVTVIARR